MPDGEVGGGEDRQEVRRRNCCANRESPAHIDVCHRHSFEVATPEATYYMFADTEKDKDEWIGQIGRAIVRFSSAFTKDDGYDDAEDSEDDDSDV